MSRQSTVDVEVACAGSVDHVLGKPRRRVIAVPPSCTLFRIEIIAERLLVEAGLSVPRLIAVSRPETRAVWCEHFIHQYNIFPGCSPSGGDASKLEFRVGDDDAALGGDAAPRLVNIPGQSFQLGGRGPSDNRAHPVDRNVLV